MTVGPDLVAEIELMFSLLRDAFKEEVDLLLVAFIHKNKLFGVSAPKDDDDEEECPKQTPEEAMRLKRIAALMGNMAPVTIRKAITNVSDS